MTQYPAIPLCSKSLTKITVPVDTTCDGEDKGKHQSTTHFLVLFAILGHFSDFRVCLALCFVLELWKVV